jgi:hypothetical protein
MKITYDNISSFHSDKGQRGVFIKGGLGGCRYVLPIILVCALAACNASQKASSSGGDNIASSASTTPGTPAPTEDAGGAVLNLRRDRTWENDLQYEEGTVPLVFSPSIEGPLLVEGTGKIVWKEEAKYDYCGFTARADGKVTVHGLFYFETCKFSLSITINYSQPTTSDQTADCTYSIVFSETEFTSRIELDPFSPHEKVSMTNDDVWTVSTVTLSDLKSAAVQNCKPSDLIFTPDVITNSTQTP